MHRVEDRTGTGAVVLSGAMVTRRGLNQTEPALTAAAGPRPPDLTPDDRLSLTLCLAMIFHALVILGIVFAPEEKTAPRYEYMDVVLVRQATDAAEDADVLAQANLAGGGDIDSQAIPAAPLPTLPQAEHTAPVEPAAPQQTEPVTEPELPQPAPAPGPGNH